MQALYTSDVMLKCLDHVHSSFGSKVTNAHVGHKIMSLNLIEFSLRWDLVQSLQE